MVVSAFSKALILFFNVLEARNILVIGVAIAKSKLFMCAAILLFLVVTL